MHDMWEVSGGRQASGQQQQQKLSHAHLRPQFPEAVPSSEGHTECGRQSCWV